MSEVVRVLVTGVGGGGLGEQTLKALRLAAGPYHLVAADITPLSVGLRLGDETCLLPPARDAGYIDALLDAIDRFEPRVVIPGSEPELRAMSESRDRIAALGVFLPIQPRSVLDICDDKFATHAFLSKAGFRQPATVRIRALEEVAAVDFFPCVLKPAVGGCGSASVFIAQDAAELEALAAHVLRVAPDVVVEEYVGNVDTEYTVGVLHDMDGGVINSIAVRRAILSGLSNRIRVPNRTQRRELGETLAISSGVSQGEIGPFPDVTRECERMAVALGARGPLNVQCRVHEGRVIAFEINPRFSGTTSLRALVGFNEPDLLIRLHVRGEAIERRFAYRTGTILRSLHEVFFEGPGRD